MPHSRGMGKSVRTAAASSGVFCVPANLASLPPFSISSCANLSASFHLVGHGDIGSRRSAGVRSMTSWVSPRCDDDDDDDGNEDAPAALCKLMLLALVDSRPGLDNWAEAASRWCSANLALRASSSFSAYLEPLRYEGTKNSGRVWSGGADWEG